MVALLEDVHTGARVKLAARHLVGRSYACFLRLARPEISGEHAAFQWQSAGWEIRDLGSRNGTFVNGHRLTPGTPASLDSGMRIQFGTVSEWALVEDGPPVAMAASADGRVSFATENGVLILPPDANRPAVTIYQLSSGQWMAARGDLVEPIHDLARVVAGSQVWHVYLPEMLMGTWDAKEIRPAVDSIGLRFAVSSDEVCVKLEILHEHDAFTVRPRAHHHTLLVLARARMADQSELPGPASSHGWLYQDDLIRRLAITSARLNLDIYRARQQFTAVGIAGAVDIVERRPLTRQLRLGVEQLEVVTL